MIPNSVREAIQAQYRSFLKANQFKPRAGQRQMIAEIARTLWHSSASLICAVEAGTGTGKTLGYLLPALATAKAKGKTLVVATATVALQEQLVNKDLPAIREQCDVDFTYALVKGRGRYACNLKLKQLAEGGTSHDSEFGPPLFEDGYAPKADLYVELQDALTHDRWDGDRDHWPNAIKDKNWNPLMTDRYQCLGRRCPHITDCVFFKVREELDEVDCLVTNQDMVLSDLALGGGVVLPDPQDVIYVFDEAHNLVDKSRNHFASLARTQNLDSLIEQIQEVASRIQELTRDASLQSSLNQMLAESGKVIPLRGELVEILAEITSTCESDLLRLPRGDVPDQLNEICGRLEIVWRNLSSRLGSVNEKIEALGESEEGGRHPLEDWLLHMGQLLGRSDNITQAWHNYAVNQDEAMARWIDIEKDSGNYGLHAIPLQPAERLKLGLWNRASGVVLTSATMTSMRSFLPLLESLGLPEDTCQVMISSPFDYLDKAELVVPKDCPNANEVDAHDKYLTEYLPSSFKLAKGTLVLFASDRQMQCIAEDIEGKTDIPLLIQGRLGKQEIVDQHRARIDDGKSSVIFGLASFAEGIDLPGEYCSHVIIAKIPFPVPDDPLIAGLGEWMESKGRNAFAAVMLPEASLSLIQASGRLLRSDVDTGRVTILDRRLITRQYGRQLLDSLPPFKRNV